LSQWCGNDDLGHPCVVKPLVGGYDGQFQCHDAVRVLA
jgi:hypothetical protein